jgi:hypothetical protein
MGPFSFGFPPFEDCRCLKGAIARVFPAHRAFVRKVIAEGIEPTSDFPFGPYPNDKLTYKNKEMVEYETPAHKDGLGTQSRLQKSYWPG